MRPQPRSWINIGIYIVLAFSVLSGIFGVIAIVHFVRKFW